MKCQKCGTIVVDQELRDELRLNRIIIVVVSIVIAVVIIAAAIYAVGALKPRPQLVGDLTTNYHYGDLGDGNYTVQVHGHIYNLGPVGCFVEVVIKLSDHRGWTSETTANLSWMPVNEIEYIFEDVQCPGQYDGEIFDYQAINLELEFVVYDPMSNDVYDN